MGPWWLLSCVSSAPVPAPAEAAPPPVVEPPAPAQPPFGVTTDRARYAAGDAVWVRPWGGGPDASPDTVWISRLRDPEGGVRGTRTWARSTRGGVLWLPRDARPGTWSVELEVDRLRASWPLQVGDGDPAVPPAGGAPAPLLLEGSVTREADGSGRLSVRTRHPTGTPIAASLSFVVAQPAAVTPLLPTAAALWNAETLEMANGGWGLQSPAPIVLGPLPRDTIDAALLAARPELDRCRDDARARDGAAMGVVVVKFAVAADGRVVESKVLTDDASDPEFGRCAAGVLGRRSLPPSAGLTIVSAPFHLRPEDEEGRGFRPSGGGTAWFEPAVVTDAEGNGRFAFPIPGDGDWVVVVRGLAGPHAGEALIPVGP